MQHLIITGLLACCIGGLVLVVKSDHFADFLVILKLRMMGRLGEVTSVHDGLIRVTPSVLRTFDFIDGAVEGRLIVFGPFNGVAKRILLLWKGDKHRCIRMNVCNVAEAEINAFYKSSLAEAKDIAEKVFQKRKPKPNSEDRAQVTQTQQSLTPTVVVAAAAVPESNVTEKEVVAEAKPELKQTQAEANGKVMKGLRAQISGKLISAQVEPHIKTGHGGTSEEYTSFTVTVVDESGIQQHLSGNDLKRAIKVVNAVPGDDVLVMHTGSKKTDAGYLKKQFEVTVLSKTNHFKN